MRKFFVAVLALFLVSAAKAGGGALIDNPSNPIDLAGYMRFSVLGATATVLGQSYNITYDMVTTTTTAANNVEVVYATATFTLTAAGDGVDIDCWATPMPNASTKNLKIRLTQSNNGATGTIVSASLAHSANQAASASQPAGGSNAKVHVYKLSSTNLQQADGESGMTANFNDPASTILNFTDGSPIYATCTGVVNASAPDLSFTRMTVRPFRSQYP